MRKSLSIVLFTVSALWWTSTYAQPSRTGERALRYDCSGMPPGINECLAAHVRDSTTELREARRFAIRRLEAWDEDERYRRLAISRLRTADAAFEKYRTAHCEFAASMGGGAIGHALDTRRLACVADLNHRHAELVRGLVDDRPPR